MDHLRSYLRPDTLADVDLRSVQRCLNSGEYTEYEIPSRTDPDIVYTVLVEDPDDIEEVICECDGFVYRGRCAHQAIALDLVCRWEEGDEEEQTPEQRKQKICPRCGDDTEWSMEIGDADL